MANIQDKIDKIKTAIFGKEVRGALADGIEAINKEVESTTGKQSHLEETFDQLIINAGTSNAEVVDARVDKTTGQTYQKLGDRLDKHSEQMDSIMSKEYILKKNDNFKDVVDNLNNGDTIFVPNGSFDIDVDIILAKTIFIRGNGNSSILNVNGTISNDDIENNKLSISNVKIINLKNDNVLLRLNKGMFRYELDHVWLHDETDNSTLIEINGATRFSFIACKFTGKSIPSTSVGVKFNDKTQNIDFSSCQFRALGTGFKAIGNVDSWEWLCGIRFVNCMIMSCNKAIHWENCDYMTFDNGMIDYCDEVIYMKNVSTPRIRGNYLFSPTRGKDIIYYEQSVTSNYLNKPDIGDNYMWNASFTANANINEGSGIHLVANGVDFKKGNIHDNDFTKLTNAIWLDAKNQGTITKVNIHDNNSSNLVRNILLELGVSNCNIRDNIIDASVSFDIVDNGINNIKNKLKTKIISIPITANVNTAIMSTGLDVLNILGISLVQNDDIYRYEPLVALTDSGTLWVKCCVMPTTNLTLKVRVNYKE